MKRRTIASVAAALVAAVISTAGDGASPGLWGGVSYLGPEELASEISRREDDLARAEARIEEIETRISTLEPEIEALSEERSEQAREARQTIILHDRMARGGMLKVVLSSASLTDAAVFAQMYSKMLERESQTFSELNEKEQSLEEKKVQLEEDREMLEKLKSDLEAHKKNLESRRDLLLKAR